MVNNQNVVDALRIQFPDKGAADKSRSAGDDDHVLSPPTYLSRFRSNTEKAGCQ